MGTDPGSAFPEGAEFYLLGASSGANSRDSYLSFLENERPQLHGEVLKTMFTFNDIRFRVEPREVSLIVKGVEEPVLLTALKWGQMQKSATVDFILENLSKRLGERLTEELSATPDVTQRDGEGAHQELVRIIQAMAKSGDLQLIEDETDLE